MLNIIKRVVVLFIALLMGYVILTGIYATPVNVALFLLMGMGIILLVIGIISNIKRSSAIKLGVINRAEFYGVVVFLMGFMMYQNNRIDLVYEILIGMK